jgi:dCTP deaminase
MAFWSGEKLAQRLPSLIGDFNVRNLDCASYRLSVGDQVFATSDKFASSAPSAALVSVLKDPPDNLLRIRPGQFAFLMTLERVRVPDDALALISIRAGYKFKGLINVSGFHVDPGWDGKLLFSVYNAGPTDVIVERGEPMFLIVYADLDRVSAETYNGASQGQVNIKASLLANMTEQVFSPLMLQRHLAELERRTNELDSKVDNRTFEIESKANQSATRISVAAYTLASVLALLFAWFAILAAFAPGWFGVTLAKTLEAAGYEIRQKALDSSSEDAAKKKMAVEELKSAAPALAPMDGSTKGAEQGMLASKPTGAKKLTESTSAESKSIPEDGAHKGE